MKKYGAKFLTRTAIAAVILVALLNTGCPNTAEKPLLPSSTPKNYKTISAVHDVYNTFYEKGYNGGTKGPILVTKGVLKTNTETQDVYLVWLSCPPVTALSRRPRPPLGSASPARRPPAARRRR